MSTFDSMNASFALVEDYWCVPRSKQTNVIDPELEDDYSHVSHGETMDLDDIHEVVSLGCDGDGDSVSTLPTTRPNSAFEPLERSVIHERMYISERSRSVPPTPRVPMTPLILTLRMVTVGAVICETIGKLYEYSALENNSVDTGRVPSKENDGT